MKSNPVKSITLQEAQKELEKAEQKVKDGNASHLDRYELMELAAHVAIWQTIRNHVFVGKMVTMDLVTGTLKLWD